MKGFKDVTAYVDGKFIKTNIGFDGEVISFVGDGVIDEPIACNGKVLPGFIDEHTHGAGGYDVMDEGPDTFKVISEVLAREGVTTYLAGSVTAPPEEIVSALTRMKNYINTQDSGAEMIGVHVEGPFLNVKRAGAHLVNCLAPLDISVAEKYIEASGNTVKAFTVAPELENGEEFVKFLKSKGICVLAGHTNATYEEFKKSVEWGVDATTHTYNAMSPIHHRDVGVVGGAMLEDVYNEVIADGVHVSYPAIKILASLKADKLILITDAMGAKGVGDGNFSICGKPVVVKHGEVRLADGTLAGSILTLDVALKNVVEKIGLPLDKAINALTVNPAKNLGIFDKYGSISAGKFANFTVLDDDFNVLMTVVKGKIAYIKG